MSTRGEPFRTSSSSSSQNNSPKKNPSATGVVPSLSAATTATSSASRSSSGSGSGSGGVRMIQQQQQQQHVKPNSKKNRTSTGGGMIQIRPYRQPPQLPTDYYESTAQTMLSGCLSMIQERLKATRHTSVASSATTTATTATTATTIPPPHLSLQSAYNTSVDLVRHQLGIRFYQDIVQNMIAASILILPVRQAAFTSSSGTTWCMMDTTTDETNTTVVVHSTSASASNPDLLEEHRDLLPYMTQQYAIYMEYILLLKHICLPLDRTHVWQWNTTGSTTCPTTTTATTTTTTCKGDDDFIKSCVGHATATTTNTSTSVNTAARSSSSSSASLSSSSSSQYHPSSYQTMWSVGLTIFIRRLQYLHYDRPIYQQWISLFINDWNPTDQNNTHHHYNSNKNSSHSTMEWNRSSEGYDTTTTTSMKKEERLLLQQIWYMWQDLQILSTLPIQNDLQDYWTKQSVEWQSTTTTTAAAAATSTISSGGYSIADFVTFCHDRMQHIHLYYRNIIQPIGWLYHIFDTCFIQHHINVQYLFNDVYFFPLLHEHLFQRNHNHSPRMNDSSSNTLSSPLQYNTIQQLWILAGRIPNGQVLMSQAIQRYAKQEGLIRIRYTAAVETVTTATGTGTATTPVDTTAATAVEDLLELQYALNMLVQQLPKGVANTLTKNSSTNETTSTASTTTISFKSVWEEVVNVDVYPMSIAEQLAKFLDNTLRSNKKMDTLAQYSNNTITTANGGSMMNTTTSMIAANTTSTTSSPTTLTSHSSLISEFSWLQRIIHGVFVPLQSKDIFEAFYKRDLSKRLLWNRIISMDAEKYICSLLKAECGTAYTSKIEGMFQDVDWSREIMLVYKQSLLAGKSSSDESCGNDVEVEVQVLTTGYWPVYPVYPNLIIPDTLKSPQEQFASHYHNKYQGRRMVWQYALGHCVVRVNGYNKPYELLVSLCQALVLIQFTSDKVNLSLPQLLQATGLDDRNEMERILQSLALGKEGTRILRKLEHTAEPGKKTKILMTIDDRDTFMINTKFESKSRRIRITNIMMKETKEEREKTVETVSRDRLYLIDAVLVRIMKARKTILHQALIPQVLEQVKVPALASDVKKRIESLIEREYMERDSKDHNRYNYLA